MYRSCIRITGSISIIIRAYMLNKITYINEIGGRRFKIPLQNDQLHSGLGPLSQTWAWVCSATPAGPRESSSASADPHHAPLESAASGQCRDSTGYEKQKHSLIYHFVETLLSETTSVLHGNRDSIIFYIIIHLVYTLCADEVDTLAVDGRR